MKLRLLLASCVIALAACAQLGIAPADTFNKKVAAGYESVATLADSADALFKSGKLSKADAQKVKATLDGATAGLASVQSIAATDPLAAQNRLAAIIAALSAAQAIVAGAK